MLTKWIAPSFVRSEIHLEFSQLRLNSFPVDRLNKPTISKLELGTRYTTVLWEILQQLRTKPPPKSAWPSGASLPPVLGSMTGTTKSGTGAIDINSTPTGKKAGSDTEAMEVCLRFWHGSRLFT